MQGIEQFSEDLKRIHALASIIRAIQVQNGYSQQQINIYLTQLLQLHLDGMSKINPSQNINHQNSTKQMIPCTTKILEKAVECLQIEIYNLSRASIQKFLGEQIKSKDQVNQNSVLIEKKQLKHHRNKTHQKHQNNSMQKGENSLPQNAKKNGKNRGYHQEYLSHLQQNGKETLDKLRKLRKYLNVKIQENKFKGERIFHKLQEMLVD